jgi:serine/threonine-protein kinase
VLRYRLGIPSAAAPLYPGRIVVSPDGAYLLWSGPSAGGSSFVPQLWLKARDDDRAIPLPGTVAALGATFSPDGQWIAYAMVGAALKKLQIRGGATITVADSVAAADAPAWLDDGTIVFVKASGRGLMRIAASGGKATEVWPSDSGLIREVSAVAGRQAVLFSRCAATDLCTSRTAWALDLRTGVGHPLMAGTVSARYLPTGHLLVVRPDGIAIVVPFDARTLEVRGTPVVVLDSVAVSEGYGASLDVSRTGTLAMLRDAVGREVKHELNWVDRAGRVTPVDMGGPLRLTGSGNAGWALSPDGRSLAIDLSNDATDAIWVKQLPTGPLSRVTLDSVPGFRPRWMPGGHELSFLSLQGARGRGLYRVSADGTGRSELLARDAQGLFEGAVSPDGKWIVARTSGGIGKAGRDIIAYRMGDTVAAPLIANPAFDESAFAISPDGRWIAYQSDESGRQEVYVRPFPLADRGRWPASTNGGAAPVWARNGRELFFVDARRQMIAVTVGSGAEPNFGERHALFTLSPDDYLDENTYYTPFDVAPDGRFIIARRVRSDGDSSPLIVAEDWFSEMRQQLERAR